MSKLLSEQINKIKVDTVLISINQYFFRIGILAYLDVSPISGRSFDENQGFNSDIKEFIVRNSRIKKY